MFDEHLLLERLNQFNPEPLVEIDESKTKENIETYVIQEDENNVDLAKTNFLNVLNNEEIKRSCENTIRKYGVGTCGPRAFYGTTDVHLELEDYIAKFLGMKNSLVYSYGFVAISSCIAAYCKQRDVIFVDENANFPIEQGLKAAKSKVIKFDHNDPNSFYKAAQRLANAEKDKKHKKYLIIEGISWKTGKLLPLVDFLKVAEDFKIRVFLDETYTFGVFGQTGRGLTEHFNIDPSRLDIIMGTLEAAVGSIGGFCAGSEMAIEHQRLAGSGYIFSASLPTYLVQACLESLRTMGTKLVILRKLSVEFHNFLQETCQFNVDSDPDCPFKVFAPWGRKNKEKEQKIFEFCKSKGVHFLWKQQGFIININIALYEDRARLGMVYDVLKQASEI